MKKVLCILLALVLTLGCASAFAADLVIYSARNERLNNIVIPGFEAATGLTIEKLLSGFHGGAHQLASKISYGEVDLLILLCDTRDAQEYMEIEVPLIRECDTHNVPAATNIATAEALILSLERGDLDWRANDRSTSFAG